MKNSRLKQALYYQLNYLGWSSLYVYGIAVVVIVVFSLSANFYVNDVNFNIATSIVGVGFIHFFIIGISGIRSDLRLFIQHGISRRTTFFSNLYGSLICSIALGLFCELFNRIADEQWRQFFNYGSANTVQSFLSGWILYAFAFFFAWQLGALISLIYYRLNKIQQTVFSVTAIAVVLFASSGAVRRLFGIHVSLGDMIERALFNVFGRAPSAILVMIVLGIIAAAANYLLLRRAPIKE